MTEQIQTPLIGPLRRRGWHEIVRVRPLTNTPHVALVVTRQGRLAGVIPANDRRVLSDYITWPYDFREVDMRERLLLIRRRVESCDAGYEFDATLKLTYQVERPERVALELEDAMTELEDALGQSMRVTSRSFGVEQATALEGNLREALLYGDVLRERLEALGLGLRRADVVVELDERARARAEALREHMRERPLLARLEIETLEPTISFDVLVGGGYRLTSRALTIVPQETHEAAIQEAIARTLRRVGISFAPHDYLAATRAMAEALRDDALLRAELSATEVELIRPTVRIQPDRQMVVAAQSAAPAPDAPDRPRRGVPLLSGPIEPADEPSDAPSWAGLGAAFGREAPRALPPPAEPHGLATDTTETYVDISPIQEAVSRTSILGAGVGSSDSAPEGQPATEATLRESESIHISGEQIDDGWRTATAAMDATDPDEQPRSEALDEPVAAADAFDPASGAQLSEGAPDLDQESHESLDWLAPLAEDEGPSTSEQDAPPWAGLSNAFGRTDSTTTSQQPDQSTAPAEDTFAAPPDQRPLDSWRITRWVALLQTTDPAMFKLRSMELIAQPETLPTILSTLTSDPVAIDGSDDPRYQHALAEALATKSKSPSSMLAPERPERVLDDEPPDWLSLRRIGQEEVQDE